MPLRINDTAPDFEAETTMGRIRFHDYVGDGWALLFSHPKDFTPVCTTELGRLAGMKAEFDFDLHARKRIDYIGVTFRTRTVEEVREILVKMRADLWDDVKAGRIRVPIDKTYPLAEARAGHEHMRANQHFGKILLVP